jgi:hypothetical protein
MVTLFTFGGQCIAGRIFNGGVGNFAHFEDCLFLRNRATEYAGAVGIILPSANAIFDSRDAITPFEFQNWYVDCVICVAPINLTCVGCHVLLNDCGTQCIASIAGKLDSVHCQVYQAHDNEFFNVQQFHGE